MRAKMKIPARIAANPDEADWADDALLTLPEGAALLWPAGPITTATLRTAAREGSLAIVKIAGKHFVTKAALKGMGAARPPPTSASAAAPGRYKKPVGAGVTVGEAPRAGTDPDYDDLIAVLDVAHERLCALRAAARAGRS